MTDDDSPKARFDRFIAEHERDLPERYRVPGRRPDAKPASPRVERWAAWLMVFGTAVALVALAVSVLAR